MDIKDYTKHAVSVLVLSRAQKVLAVSRKDNPADFGLPGGKMDGADSVLTAAAGREFREETGMDLTIKGAPLFNKFTGKYHDTTFYGTIHNDVFDMKKANADLTARGEGRMAWVDWNTLYNGTFGEYNRQINKAWYDANLLDWHRLYGVLLTGEIFYVHDFIKINDALYYVVVSNMADEPMFVRSTALRRKELIAGPIFNGVMSWDLFNVPEPIFYAPFEIRKAAISSHHSTNHYYHKQHHLYSYHLGRVVNVFHRFKHLVPESDRATVESGLWFHDGVEDARLTKNDVKKLSNSEVADIAYRLTNMRVENRDERASPEYYRGIREIPYGPLVKACDRTANVEESIAGGNVSMYRKENDKFESMLRLPNDGLDQIFDYLREIVQY